MLSCSDNENEISIPFVIENNRIILEAVVNGQKGRFIFDSGVMISLINISARNLFPAGYTKREINEKLKTVFVYALNKIYFRDRVVKARSWLINRSDMLTYINETEGYDGILGIRTFEGYWCELSFSKQSIVLHKEKPQSYLNYLPLKVLSKFDALYMPIIIDNTVFYMNIDTGLQSGILFPNDVIKQKNNNECREIVSNEEVERYYLVKTGSIKILDETYNNMSIMTNSYSAQRRNYVSHNDMGLIGVNFLKYYDLLFDYRELRKGKTTGMYYKPIVPLSERDYGFYSFLKDVPEPGILDFYLSDSGLEIISIIKDSLVYTNYGLRPGTVITKVNNRSISNFTKEELLDPLFYQRVTEFSILDEGHEKTIFLHNP